MDDKISYYIKGSQEGYFDVRLEKSILVQDHEVRSFFLNGYKFGKSMRKSKDSNKYKYDEYRKSYITIMGFKAATEGCTMDSSLLKGDEKKAFDDGFRVGLLSKEEKTNQLSTDEYSIYAMAMGYEAHEEGFSVYLDIINENIKPIFHTGYSINKLCNDIEKKAIDHLNESQFRNYTRSSRK